MKDSEPHNVLVLKLREANQHLVIAALEAKDMHELAETNNLRQKEFLSMLAHELRNPLAPISLAVELLGKLTASHPQLPDLHRIFDRQVAHMTHLVEDLLDASRVSTGKITLQQQPILLSEIIESAVETSRPFIDRRAQELSVDLSVNPVVIEGDLVRLAQVFSNLLINAAKFTPEQGHIALSANRNSNAVTITVKDDGAGIAPDVQPFIFDLFAQGPRTLDRSSGGLGIGLTLVRSIIEMHGGTVWVKSDGIGLGSEFSVSLPVSTKPLRRGGAPEQQTIVAPRRVLLVDDNTDAVETLRTFLTLEGHVVTCRFDGPSGLLAAVENIYDVIICDIGLPGMSGYELVRQLQSNYSRPAPRLIAISGYNPLQKQARASVTGGFDHFLVKPADATTLLRLISLSALR